MSDFVATETQAAFMTSPAYVRVLAGPIGGGKSVACAHELLRLAADQAPNAQGVRKTRALIVRNTADQLALTTRKTVFDWFPPGQAGVWKAQEKTFLIRARLPDMTIMESEWLFIALDTPDDVRRALSLEATFLWGNECRELHPEVVDGLLGRINRYPSKKDGGATRACAIFDTNMPDEETWWHDKMENPPSNWTIHIQPPAIFTKAAYVAKFNEDAEQYLLDNQSREWAVNPGADNLANLAESYYPNIIPGKSEDWLRVYLRSEYGRSLSGRPVYDNSFVPDAHIAKGELLPVRAEGYPIIIGLDFGRTPAAIFMQRDPRGRILVLSECVATNMGIETFLKEPLATHIAKHYPGAEFIVAPDPAGFAKQQLNELSLVDVLRRAGYRCVRPPTNDPDRRIAAVDRLLSLMIGGQPGFLIDPEKCPTLVRGFRYGYRYKQKKNGDFEDRPEKNEYSHPHDALQYGAQIIDMSIRGVALLPSAQKVEKVNFVYT